MAADNVVGLDTKKESRIKFEWTEFAKQTAFKDLMEFAELHEANLLKYAEDLAMPGPDGKVVNISGEMANFLLQRRAGIGILKTYIRLYTE